MAFDIESEIKKATVAYLAADGITIPASIRSSTLSTVGWPRIRPETKCWECGSEQNVMPYGIHSYCSGCRAAMRQEERELRGGRYD